MRRVYFGLTQIVYALSTVLILWLGIEFINAMDIINVKDKDVFVFMDASNTFIVLMVAMMSIIVGIIIKREAVGYSNLINCYIMVLLLTLCYVFLKNEDEKCRLSYIVLYIFSYTALKCMQTYIHMDNTLEEKGLELFSEETAGGSFLSKSQIKAYEQIIEVVDSQEKQESINLALIAGWGKGKTTIINEVIKNLKNRKKTENQYFILEINAVTFEKNADLVEYVNRYFETLFHRYVIKSNFLLGDIPYLTILAELIDEEKGTVIKRGIDNLWKGDKFVDITRERLIFSEQVQRLLRVSKRKNIILIIDDADRRNATNQIKRVLAEFSAIKGIICIVLLSDQNDIRYRPGSETTGEIIEKDTMSDLDKYIHLRIRMDQDKQIENAESIKQYMIMAYKNVMKGSVKLRGVECPNMLDASILKVNASYSTFVKGKQLKANALFDLFFENLCVQDIHFGTALEEIVIEYFNNCIEVQNYNMSVNELSDEIKKYLLPDVGMQWNMYKVIENEEFTWIESIESAIGQMLGSMFLVLDALKNNAEKKILKPGELVDLFQLNALVNDNLMQKAGIHIQMREIIPMLHYRDFTTIIYLAFGKDVDKINKCIKVGDYDTVYMELKNKYQELLNTMVMILTLKDFLIYVRKIMNNYRTLKIQLRESVVLRINYLDYLLEEWSVSEEIIKQVNGYKELFAFKDDVSITSGRLKDYINNMLYTKYILGYGTNNIRERLEKTQRRVVWITCIENDKYIVICLPNEKENHYIIKDMRGNLLEEVSEALMKKAESDRKELGIVFSEYEY